MSRFQSQGMKTFYRDPARHKYYIENNLDVSTLETYEEEVFLDTESSTGSIVRASDLELNKEEHENAPNHNDPKVQEFIQEIEGVL